MMLNLDNTENVQIFGLYCVHCKLEFVCQRSKTLHFQSDRHNAVVNGRRPNPIRDYPCFMCWEAFEDEASLEKHYLYKSHRDRMWKYGVTKVSHDLAEKLQDVWKDSPKACGLSQDVSKDSTTDFSTDESMGLPQDLPKDLSHSLPQEDISRCVPKGSPPDLLKDLSHGLPQELPKDFSMDLPKGLPQDSNKGLPQDSNKGLPQDLPKDSSHDQAKDLTKDVSKELLNEPTKDDELPKGLLKDSPNDLSMGLLKNLPLSQEDNPDFQSNVSSEAKENKNLSPIQEKDVPVVSTVKISTAAMEQSLPNVQNVETVIAVERQREVFQSGTEKTMEDDEVEIVKQISPGEGPEPILISSDEEDQEMVIEGDTAGIEIDWNDYIVVDEIGYCDEDANPDKKKIKRNKKKSKESMKRKKLRKRARNKIIKALMFKELHGKEPSESFKVECVKLLAEHYNEVTDPENILTDQKLKERLEERVGPIKDWVLKDISNQAGREERRLMRKLEKTQI